jgi:hypothetical protein
MAIGTREQPEKQLDAALKPKSFRRISRKRLKRWQNRKDRRRHKINPDAPPRPKYKGWEW